tara:strand:- start:156 stop:854 length:699 start_codon:yes stop_codon:yes gene_type:complete
MRTLIATCFALTLTASALAQNNGLPTQRQGLVLVETIAQRGVECDLLRPWESQALRAQTSREMAAYDAETRAEIEAEIASMAGEMACDAPFLNAWIEGAHPGFEREMLPFFLVGYTAFAQMDTPPALFTEMTGRDNFDLPLSMVGAEIERLQSNGVMPEGGVEWPAFEARIDEAAADIAGALRGEEGGDFPAEEAAGYVRDIATVTELWLTDQMTETENSDTNSDSDGSEDE